MHDISYLLLCLCPQNLRSHQFKDSLQEALHLALSIFQTASKNGLV